VVRHPESDMIHNTSLFFYLKIKILVYGILYQ
jgi:hypothetical protein